MLKKSRYTNIGIVNQWDAESIAKSIPLLELWAEKAHKYKLDWWLAYGTLLGQVHFGHPLPWDDDYDIEVLVTADRRKDFYEMLLELDSEFEDIDVYTYKRKLQGEMPTRLEALYRLSWPNPEAVSGWKNGWPFIDILPCLNHQHVEIKELLHNNRRPIEVVLPTRKSFFMDVEVKIPNRPLEYLERRYSRLCFNSACQTWRDHRQSVVIVDEDSAMSKRSPHWSLEVRRVVKEYQWAYEEAMKMLEESINTSELLV